MDSVGFVDVEVEQEAVDKAAYHGLVRWDPDDHVWVLTETGRGAVLDFLNTHDPANWGDE